MIYFAPSFLTLAISCDIKPENIFIMENGDVLDLTKNTVLESLLIPNNYLYDFSLYLTVLHLVLGKI